MLHKGPKWLPMTYFVKLITQNLKTLRLFVLIQNILM